VLRRKRVALVGVTRESFKGTKPRRINQGWCYVWALLSKRRHPELELYSFRTYGAHAFVGYDGLFYDAQRPNGVRDWWSLPYFAENVPRTARHIVIKQSEYGFVQFWSREGGVEAAKKQLRKIHRTARSEVCCGRSTRRTTP